MKNFKLLFYVLSFTLIFTSCKSDDDDSSSVDADIVGLWKLDEYTGVTTSTFSSTGLPDFITTVTLTGSNFNAFTTFSENPNVFSSTGDFDMNISTEVTGVGETSQDINFDYDEIENGGTWEINGNEVEFNFLDPSQLPAGVNLEDLTTEIIELSSTTLRVKLFGTTVNDNGTTNEMEYFSSYSRQ